MIRAILAITVIGAGNALACDSSDAVALTPQDVAAPPAVIILGDVPLAQPFSALIKICEEGPIAALELDAVMPAHQHGMNYLPTITHLGKGDFRAEGLVFHMPGVWEFRIKMTQETGVSHYTHTVTVR